MNRIAAFLQKAGAPRDRLLDDAELAALIAHAGDNAQTFFHGHDYDAVDLARFFDRARTQGVALNAQERRLLGEIEASGWLRSAGGPGASSRALVTFSAVQPDDPSTSLDEGVDALRREAVLRHEVSHGRFYTSVAYRDHCLQWWRTVLDESQREAIRRFLASLGYDRANELLMANEAQAFLMNTPDPRAFRAADIGMSETTLATLREEFWRTIPMETADSASPPR